MTKTFGATFRFLGILAGGMSLFILAQTAFSFGLSDAFEGIVSFYAALVYPILGFFEPTLLWLLSWVPWGLPEHWKDLFVLYLIGVGAWARNLFWEEQLIAEELLEEGIQADVSTSVLRRALALCKAAFWPLSLLFETVTDLVYFMTPAGRKKLEKELGHDIENISMAEALLGEFRLFLLEVFWVIVAFVVFVALNSGL